MDKEIIYTNTKRNKEVNSFFWALLIACIFLFLARNSLEHFIALSIGALLYLCTTFYLLIKKTRQFFFVKEISVLSDGIISFRIEVFSLYYVTKKFKKNDLIVDKRRMRFGLAMVRDIISFDSLEGKFMFWIPYDKDTFELMIASIKN